MAYFLIVSRQDVPLYECELSSTVKARSPGHVQSSVSIFRLCPSMPKARAGMTAVSSLQKDESSHLHQFILHAALDMVEERLWDTNSCYLKARPTPAGQSSLHAQPEDRPFPWYKL